MIQTTRRTSYHLIAALAVATSAPACAESQLGAAGDGQGDGQESSTEDALTGPSPTACYVYLNSPCLDHPEVKGFYPINQWFADSYDGATVSNGRCLQRAREWFTWCGFEKVPVQTFAAASFNIDIGSISSLWVVGGLNQGRYEALRGFLNFDLLMDKKY